jgi:NRAMP (natural resistance-associated macrophage protein)-like metal ion transporter
LGPGLITGASDDDPSGIGTYAAAGAAFGYALLWLAPLTFPLMAAVQLICARIGMVSGMGLAGVLRASYPRWLLYAVVLLLAAANTINAGADIGAIAAALHLLTPVPALAFVPLVALGLLTMQIWGSYRLIARIFKWLALALLAYVGAALLAHPDWRTVWRGTVVPSVQWNAAFLAMLVGILGTTISPYLFFWQASEEVEEEIDAGRTTTVARRGATPTELRLAAWDVDLGMLWSNVVMYFIMLATAATLHGAGQTRIGSAADAATALEPLAGRWAATLFAFGLIGSGLLAVPILTGSAGYAIAEASGWRSGLHARPADAPGFYAVIAMSTLIGAVVASAGFDPIAALVGAAVINGLLAPPLLALVMSIANNRAVMGEQVNGRLANLLGWTATALMFAAGLGLLLALAFPSGLERLAAFFSP